MKNTMLGPPAKRGPISSQTRLVLGMTVSTSEGSSGTTTAEDPSIDPSPDSGRQTLVDRLPRSVVVVLTVVGFALPVCAFLGSTVAYSVNIVMYDNLSIMPFVKASETRIVPWGPLSAQYNQDRSFFPNALSVVLAHVDHLDMRVENTIGALMVVIGTHCSFGPTSAVRHLARGSTTAPSPS